MALSLIPPVGWSPSFGFEGQAGSVEELLEQVSAALATPRSRINMELAFIAERQPLPSWARQLADDATLRKELVDELATLYAIMLGPYEAQLTGLFAADRGVRMRQFLSGCVEHLLAQANPQWLRWNPPVLEIRMANGVDYDLCLEGQGVLLVPSMFSARPLVENETQPQPIVTYPAGHDHPLRRLTTFAPEAPKSRPSRRCSAGPARRC
jgi:hypothetical protein